ncbi:MAG: trigger factor, partial [Lachnospiraceae bacterium]|nr:trigger factor [Lachnospiraceae bacterium]
LVKVADAISAGRPGARRDTLEIYIKRLQKIEEIVNSYEGIKQSFAVQAGREVRIIVEAEKFDAAMQKAYLKLRGRINIPGVRRGRAPRKLIENMYGEAIFHDEAMDQLFPEVYTEAVEGEKLNAVDRPELEEITQIGSGKELKFSVKVYVSPDIELGEYKDLKAVRYVHTVTEEEVDARIARDVEKATTTEDVTDRALENGDIANLDYAGTVDGVAFAGGTAQGQTLEIGSGTFIPGFEEQMIGMAIGEEKDLKVSFPEGYQAEELAGKEAVFHVKLNGIQVKVKPELDDEFAADVSEFSTFAEYRDDIRRRLQETADKNADTELENTLVQSAVDACDCDIPDAMIESELDAMMRELQMRMAYQGMRMADFLRYTNQTEEQVRENYRSEAHNRVKTQLVLEAIGKAENIQVSDEEAEQAVKDEAEREGREVEEFKASLNDRQREYLRENAVIRKTVDLIRQSAVIEEKNESERLNARDAANAVRQAAEAVEEAVGDEEETEEESENN